MKAQPKRKRRWTRAQQAKFNKTMAVKNAPRRMAYARAWKDIVAVKWRMMAIEANHIRIERRLDRIERWLGALSQSS
jgi:hypothetical protein